MTHAVRIMLWCSATKNNSWLQRLCALERSGADVDKKNLTNHRVANDTRARAKQIQRRFMVGPLSISPTADRSYLGPKSSHRHVTNLGTDGSRSGSIGNHWQRRVSLNCERWKVNCCGRRSKTWKGRSAEWYLRCSPSRRLLWYDIGIQILAGRS